MSRSSSPSHAHKRGSHHGGGGGGSHEGGDGGGGGGGGGKLIKVAFARTQPEAEMMQGLLSESGITSLLKRSRGFDAPEFMAAGPHDVLVNAEQAKKAKAVLADTITESEAEERAELGDEARLRRGGPATETSAGRLAFWVGVALVAAIILVWLLYQLT